MRSPLRSRFAFIVVLALSAACCRAREQTYEQALTSARAAKDEMLRASVTSPVPASKRAAILPLSYFPPDASYRVPAALEAGAAASSSFAGAVMEVPTSSGKPRRVQVVGSLEFSVKGQRAKLTAFAEEGSNGERLFVPFWDRTSGHETYGGGRYLDLDRTSTGIYVIDFNTAYNPYCAYNPTYECPLPPPENRLSIDIRAGEKTPRAH